MLKKDLIEFGRIVFEKTSKNIVRDGASISTNSVAASIISAEWPKNAVHNALKALEKAGYPGATQGAPVERKLFRGTAVIRPWLWAKVTQDQFDAWVADIGAKEPTSPYSQLAETVADLKTRLEKLEALDVPIFAKGVS